MQTEKTINLEIAGYKLILIAEDNLQLYIDSVYTNFLVLFEKEFDIRITTHKGFSPVNVKNENVFVAKITKANSFDLPQCDWDVYKDTEDIYIRIFSSLEQNKIETILKVNNTKEWDIYIHEDLCKDNIAEPLRHPAGSLILYYLTALHGDVFLHSSGISDGLKGRIFSGFSGVGKSTMAEIWKRNGASVIHDDRLILRKNQSDWYMYNTPVYLNDSPKSTKVDEIFLVKHASANCSKELVGATAAARLFAYCIQHDFDKSLIEKLLRSVADLCYNTKVYELGFVPDEKILDHIRSLKKSL